MVTIDDDALLIVDVVSAVADAPCESATPIAVTVPSEAEVSALKTNVMADDEQSTEVTIAAFAVETNDAIRNSPDIASFFIILPFLNR